MLRSKAFLRTMTERVLATEVEQQVIIRNNDLLIQINKRPFHLFKKMTCSATCCQTRRFIQKIFTATMLEQCCMICESIVTSSQIIVNGVKLQDKTFQHEQAFDSISVALLSRHWFDCESRGKTTLLGSVELVTGVLFQSCSQTTDFRPPIPLPSVWLLS